MTAQLRDLIRQEIGTSIDNRLERYEVELPVTARLLDGDDLERFSEVIASVDAILKARHVASMERATTERPTAAGKGRP